MTIDPLVDPESSARRRTCGPAVGTTAAAQQRTWSHSTWPSVRTATRHSCHQLLRFLTGRAADGKRCLARFAAGDGWAIDGSVGVLTCVPLLPPPADDVIKTKKPAAKKNAPKKNKVPVKKAAGKKGSKKGATPKKKPVKRAAVSLLIDAGPRCECWGCYCRWERRWECRRCLRMLLMLLLLSSPGPGVCVAWRAGQGRGEGRDAEGQGSGHEEGDAGGRTPGQGEQGTWAVGHQEEEGRRVWTQP